MSKNSISFLQDRGMLAPGYSIFEINGDFGKIELNSLLDQYAALSENGKCEHSFEHLKSECYWRYCGRNNREYYNAEHYFCSKCLKKKIVEQKHSEFDGQLWRLPEWAKLITNKIAGTDI